MGTDPHLCLICRIAFHAYLQQIKVHREGERKGDCCCDTNNIQKKKQK